MIDWLKLAVIGAAALGAMWLYHHWAEGLRDEGRVQVRQEFAARDAQAVKTQQAEEKARLAEVKLAEHEAQDTLRNSAQEWAKSTQEALNAKDRDLAAARAGTKRLSVAVAGCSGSQPTGLPGTPGTGRLDDAPARADILPAVAADILAIGYDADAITRQLAVCQSTVTAYRRLAGRPAQ